MHAVEYPVYPDTFGGLPIDLETPAKAAQVRLVRMAATLLPGDLAGKTRVCYGSAYGNICSTAETWNTDLIVISTHGRTGLSRALLGSTAERVVRHAHCPVLTVRRRPDAIPMESLKTTGDRLPWRRILVPLDFSLTSLRALDVAVRLARDNGARLCLLHVVEPTPYATGMDGVALSLPDSVFFERAEATLPKLARRLVPSSVQVVTWVVRGRPASVIVQTANAKGIDLIVLSTHGHRGLGRFMIGSTAERVVRQAACPVLVVRHRRRTSQ